MAKQNGGRSGNERRGFNPFQGGYTPRDPRYENDPERPYELPKAPVGGTGQVPAANPSTQSSGK
jgi:hypothetical protein